MYDLIRNVLSKKKLNEYELILKETPFNIDNVYINSENDLEIIMIRKCYFSSIIFGDIKMFSFMMPHCISIYKKIKALIEAKNFKTLFNTYIEKRDLINVFIDLFDDISDDDKFGLFIDVYTRAEYGFEEFDESFLMEISDYKTKSQYNVPRAYITDNVVTVYRGVADKSVELGFSWSLDVKIAEWFSQRFNSNGYIVEATIEKKDIIAFIDKRNEKEVILLPSKIIHKKKWN